MGDRLPWAELSPEQQQLFGQVPPNSTFRPVRSALSEESAAAGPLKRLASMPESTAIFANPPLYKLTVPCTDDDLVLNIRSFAIRGILKEAEIVRRDIGPFDVIFVGLFGRLPKDDAEKRLLSGYIDDCFYDALLKEDGIVATTVKFSSEFPHANLQTAAQLNSARRRAVRAADDLPKGLNTERAPHELLGEMIATHMENVAVGATSIYGREQLAAGKTCDEAVAAVQKLASEQREAGSSAFACCFAFMLGRPAKSVENEIMETLGTIQIHHGSAGSNMVARYVTSLFACSVSDFFTAAHIAMDADRHFGAIHDMTRLVHELEECKDESEIDGVIADRLQNSRLPTFGHPEIAAAGRGSELQQDPRPAIYLDPLFRAIDAGEIELTQDQLRRLGYMERMYKVAFVDGVHKENREDDGALRLATNTDFGAWCVSEALGISDDGRTFTTLVFRGFGWMMDSREQLHERIIRPVVAPDPAIVPKADGDTTIPDTFARFHQRMAAGNAFVKK